MTERPDDLPGDDKDDEQDIDAAREFEAKRMPPTQADLHDLVILAQRLTLGGERIEDGSFAREFPVSASESWRVTTHPKGDPEESGLVTVYHNGTTDSEQGYFIVQEGEELSAIKILAEDDMGSSEFSADDRLLRAVMSQALEEDLGLPFFSHDDATKALEKLRQWVAENN